jgi:hypothetical protein
MKNDSDNATSYRATFVLMRKERLFPQKNAYFYFLTVKLSLKIQIKVYSAFFNMHTVVKGNINRCVAQCFTT